MKAPKKVTIPNPAARQGPRPSAGGGSCHDFGGGSFRTGLDTILVGMGVSLFALLLYLLTAAHDLITGDTPEFLVAAKTSVSSMPRDIHS